jgi:hypothetical protein
MDIHSLTRKLAEYTLLPFDQDKDKGPRRDRILADLKALGLNPKVDERGNVWTYKGPAYTQEAIPLLVSSHMDTVFGPKPMQYVIGRTGSQSIAGTIDNSLGCALNYALAADAHPANPTFLVFTVHEERMANTGAEAVLKKFPGPKPVCITVDVTPDDLKSPYNVENVRPENKAPYLLSFIERITGNAPTHKIDAVGDESNIYGKETTAFSICPVVSEGVHNRVCTVDPLNIEATFQVLKKLLEHPMLGSELEMLLAYPESHLHFAIQDARAQLWRQGFLQSESWHEEKGELATYVYLPSGKRNGRQDDLMAGSKDSDLISRIKENGAPNPLNHSLGIGLASLRVKTKFRAQGNPENILEYAISFHCPQEMRRSIDFLSGLSGNSRKAAGKDNGQITYEYEFPLGAPNPVLDIFLAMVKGYSSLAERCR